METAALVDRNGSIDWLCWPDFSSEACFASLLGTDENGYWKIAPAGGHGTASRRYRDHTLILETTFEQRGGAVRLIDFMPPRGRNSDVVRIVEGVRGSVPMRMELALRFDFGHTVPWVTGIHDGVRAVAGPNLAILHASVPVHGENLTTVAEFTVRKGQRAWFTLTYGSSYEPDPKTDQLPSARSTIPMRIWRSWSRRLKYKGKYRDAVERSLITLKAMTFRPTGGIVAAATTSLPESIGGVRNWDYRYCWLRDTTFTLLALMNGGYFDEAAAWQDWLLRALAGSPDQVQIMYGLKGERSLTEWKIDWLTGYENSRPVRVGNAAAEQMQLDIYGEMLDSFFHAQHSMHRHDEDDFRVLAAAAGASGDHLARTRSTASGRRAAAAALHLFQDDGLGRLRSRRAAGRAAQIRRACGKMEVASATTIHAKSAPGLQQAEEQLHAGLRFRPARRLLLLMPAVGFLPGSDPRVKGTVKPSSASSCQMASCCATTRRKSMTACLRAKASFSPAASGWSVPSSHRPQARCAGALREASAPAQRPWPAFRGIRSRAPPHGGKLSPGLLAHRPGQCRLLP